MKRQREKHITRLHIILFFLVLIIGLIIFFVIKGTLNNSSNKYKEYEETLENAAENYAIINNIVFYEGFEERIDIVDIVNQGLVRSDIIDECEGYVIVRRERNIATEEIENIYKAYIKCGDKYRSTNYSSY